MKNMPEKAPVIFSAPMGWGKTIHSHELLAEFGKCRVVDGWRPGDPLHIDNLHLTNAHPKECSNAAHHGAVLVHRGWYDKVEPKTAEQRATERRSIAAQLLAAEVSVSGYGRISAHDVTGVVKLADALLLELAK